MFYPEIIHSKYEEMIKKAFISYVQDILELSLKD